MLEFGKERHTLTHRSLDGQPASPREMVPGSEADFLRAIPQLFTAPLSPEDILAAFHISKTDWPENRLNSVMGTIMKILRKEKIISREDALAVAGRILKEKGIVPDAHGE